MYKRRLPRLPIERRLLALLLLVPSLGLFAMGGAAAGEAKAAGDSRFQRTVVYMREATPGLRADFADTALRHLSVAYTLEAELAREEAGMPGGDRTLLAWSVAVEQYASALPLLLEDIELGFPVELSVAREESPGVAVAGRTVILSHPRPDQQSVFEGAVLADFCARHDCEQFTPGTDSPQPIPVTTTLVKPDWSFTEKGPICAYRGIEVRFSGNRELARHRMICEQFLQEVMTLIDELAWQRRHAVKIDWDGLVIKLTPHRPEHRVQLNANGESILLAVPLLYGSPGLLQDITGWLRLRLDGDQSATLQIEAVQYGWEGTGAAP